jgi:hypothetical protein
MVITPELVLSLNPCWEYTPVRLKQLLGKGKTLLEVLDMKNVPPQDIVWFFLHKEILPVKTLQLLALDFAKHVLPIYEKQCSNDKRPRKAIQAGYDYLKGKITRDQLKVATDTAVAAAYTAYAASYATDAAFVAAAAHDAAYAAYDAAYAAHAAYVAAAAHAVIRERKWQVKLIKKYVTKVE